MGVGCRKDVASISRFFFASPTCLPRPSFVCRVPGGDYDGLPLLARPRAWLGDLHSLTMGVAAIRCGKAPDAVSAFSHAMAVSRPTVPVSCSGCGCLAADTPPPFLCFPALALVRTMKRTMARATRAPLLSASSRPAPWSGG